VQELRAQLLAQVQHQQQLAGALGEQRAHQPCRQHLAAQLPRALQALLALLRPQLLRLGFGLELGGRLPLGALRCRWLWGHGPAPHSSRCCARRCVNGGPAASGDR
jgi:hypothetical protein